MNRWSPSPDEPPAECFGNDGEPVASGRVRCILQIARTNLPIEIPAEVLEKHRLLSRDNVVLRITGGAAPQSAPVGVAPLLSATQQKLANRWIAEMEDFDRF